MAMSVCHQLKRLKILTAITRRTRTQHNIVMVQSYFVSQSEGGAERMNSFETWIDKFIVFIDINVLYFRRSLQTSLLKTTCSV